MNNQPPDISTQFLNALKAQDQSGEIWIDSPFNLYRDRRQAEEYLALMTEGPYSDLFHDPVKTLLTEYGSEILKDSTDPVSLIDFGPGYPDKSFALLRILKRHHGRIEYIPLDINKHFLEIATQAVAERFDSIQLHPVQALFEDAPNLVQFGKLGSDASFRIALLGLTFMNYRSDPILQILKSVISSEGIVIVATELIDSDSASPEIAYNNVHVEEMNRLALAELDLPLDRLKYFSRFVNSRVELGFRVKDEMGWRGMPIKSGSEIITAISARYSIERFESVLDDHFSSFAIHLNEERTVALGVGKI